jgi:hypothetical protein
MFAGILLFDVTSEQIDQGSYSRLFDERRVISAKPLGNTRKKRTFTMVRLEL